MELFNVGIPEFLLVLVLAFILLGPEGMVKTARDAGRLVRRFLQSPLWASLRQAERELRQVPTRLVREAGLDEIEKELNPLGGPIAPPNTAEPHPGAAADESAAPQARASEEIPPQPPGNGKKPS